MTKALTLLIGVLMATAAFGVELDEHGCRVLSALPEPGVHPRVFFTADEYPLIRQRLNAPKFKTVFDPVRQQVIGKVKRQWTEFSERDMSNPSDADILKYFVPGEGRNQEWGIASLTAALTEDAALLELMKGVITNYAHIILASKQRAIGGELTGRTGTELNQRLRIWESPSFDVGVSWTFGAAGYAVSYDVLYSYMSETQRDTVRRAIATATTGRISYGNGMPRGFAVSNHYGYHGDLAALLAAVEGEKGFDQKTWDGIVQVLRDYWEVGFTPTGACHEDGYGPNLGMRAGSRGFMVLARRGYNIFNTRKYRNFINYMTLDYDPYPGGHFNGGASGGPYDELYPTSSIIARYMYPQSPAANFNYRHLIGENYERRLRWQGWLDYFLYGSDWTGAAQREEMLEQAGLAVSVYYPERGKFIARSDWTGDAMYATLDARPDAHTIGHDKVDRGNFSMSALGRIWAFSGDFHTWDSSRENSLVHIDGKAEPWKAPSVRFLWHGDASSVAGAAADLKYAYDWQWSPPWPKWGQAFPAPWGPETNGPVDLGWPAAHANADLCPASIHGSGTGYGGTNNLHRRPYNLVQRAQRSLFLVRAKHPFTIICDDIRKDDAPHLYEWVMQLPTDLHALSAAGNQIILGEAKGDRRLLVRFLQDGACTIKIESYEANKDRQGEVTTGKRLIASLNTIEPAFRILLYPFREGQTPPTTQWHDDRTVLHVDFGNQVKELRFITTDADGTKVALVR